MTEYAAVLTFQEHSTCRLCGLAIYRYHHDGEPLSWWHTDTQSMWCAAAPITNAQPEG